MTSPSNVVGIGWAILLALLTILILTILGPSLVWAAEPLILDPQQGRYKLISNLEILHDPQGGLTIADVSSPEFSARFKALDNYGVYVIKDQPVAWLRFRLSEQTSHLPAPPRKWLLEIAPSFPIIMDKVDYFQPRGHNGPNHGSGEFVVALTGAQRPAPETELLSRNFLFELPGDLQSDQYFYIRLESSMDVSVSINIWSAKALHRNDLYYYGAFGLIYGVLLSMILYNLFIYIALKDRAYFFYVLYITSSLFWLLWVHGHSRLIFGRFPVLDFRLLWAFVGSLLFWASLFARSFLNAARSIPRLAKMMLFMAGLGAFSVLAGLAGLTRAAFLVSHFCGLALPPILILAAVLRLKQGFKAAKYFVLAWAALIVGGVAFALMGLQILPVGFATTNGAAIAMAMEAVFLGLALADRIRDLRKEKEYYQEGQRRFQELSLTDGLTGLYNKRYLLSKLASETDHAQRLEQPLSLVMIDIDDFKVINDTHGHLTGDGVLILLSSVIRRHIRDKDTACRFGGEEFTLLLPGATGQDAWQVAERIRTGFQDIAFQPDEKTRISSTISLGLVARKPDESADSLLERGDHALYEAKKRGKNMTFMAD